MRGLFLSCFGVACMTFFSFVLFTSGDLLFIWLVLEIASLSLVPCFFLHLSSGVFFSMFSYILVSGLSSGLIVGGLLVEGYIFLAYVGLAIKFGVFPFMGWVYLVFSSSNWVVVWALSTVLKVSFLVLFFYLGVGYLASEVIQGLCFLTLLVVSFLFWVFSFSWEYYWCHSALSTSAVFLCMSCCYLPLDSLVYLFFIYVIWVSLAIFVVSRFDDDSTFSGVSYYWFVGLLVSFPLSLVVAYKFYIGLHLFPCGLLVFISWVVCGVSEQLYLLKFLFSASSSYGGWDGSSRV